MRYAFLLLVAVVTACNPVKSVREALDHKTPYEKYIRKLEDADLRGRPMVADWLAAGERAMNDSVFVQLPLTETGQFLSHEPAARSYRFTVMDGQVLKVSGMTTATADARIFMDIFTLEDGKWKHQASADSALALSHEFNRNTTCLLRLQPELLVNAYYSLSISLTPVLINPVSGASNKSIQSFYGDSRDGGKRSHEGVDIFAKKGTPVIAPADGTISRTGLTRLGGKVVWMQDKKRQHSYYFAHLDSQFVTAGLSVRQGDTLGTVGNTGNARFTPPHLHFGIYQSRSKDPLYYIRTLDAAEPAIIDTAFRINVYRVARNNQKLMSGPNAKDVSIRSLNKDSYVRVIARSGDWYRVALPDHIEGYLPLRSVTAAMSGVTKKLIADKTVTLHPRSESTIINFLPRDTPVEVLARTDGFEYVRIPNGGHGWIDTR